ncbi:MAG: hypothetical protein J5I47_07010 [Vicingus serpentipes]|nr:hypothetical protein [Vicingus serpentipes]
MKAKEIVLVAIFIFTINLVAAQQAPGYLGKRLVLSYTPKFMLSAFNPNKNGEQGFTTFNYAHRFSLDFAANRKISYGVAFEMYSTGMEPEFTLYKHHPASDHSSSWGSDYPESYYYEGYGRLNVKGVSLYRYKYKKGIAPLGKHSILGVKLLYASMDFSDLEFSNTYYIGSGSHQKDYYNLSSSETSVMQLGFVWGYGVNRIVADKVTLRLGVESTLFPLKLFSMFQSVEDDDYYLNYGETSLSKAKELFQKQAIKRMAQVEAFNITLGIGFLAY